MLVQVSSKVNGAGGYAVLNRLAGRKCDGERQNVGVRGDGVLDGVQVQQSTNKQTNKPETRRRFHVQSCLVERAPEEMVATTTREGMAG